MNKLIKLKENQLHRIIKEVAETMIVGEGGSNYTHFAVNKLTNLIIFSWDYSGYPSNELMSGKKYYFYNDIKDNGFNPKYFKIISRKHCSKMGIDPNDEKNNWSNTGVLPISQENKMGLENAIAYSREKHPEFYID